MWTKLLINLTFVLTLLSCRERFPAQVSIADEEYDKMLKKLLSHSVEEILPKAITEDYLVLDAREKSEFDISHLPKSQWVGYDDFDISRINQINKDQKIVVYCSVGYRSERIAEKLKKEGFNHVSNLYGGIFHWYNQGFPLENDQGQTHNIHGYNRTWSKWIKKGNISY
ncbi:MAG: rhodanese-like domain-containing protein [Bacteroidota bacterium]